MKRGVRLSWIVNSWWTLVDGLECDRSRVAELALGLCLWLQIALRRVAHGKWNCC
jgi:hypothetical protein